MAHLGRLAEYKFSGKDVDDIRGSAVYGLDDKKMGKIDDVIFDHASGDIQYVVVDTGGWLSSKKFIVPADQLKPSVEHTDDYHVDLTKTQVESFPPYDENAVESQDQWTDYENQYRSAWTTSPVQHQEGTARNITPPTGGVRNSDVSSSEVASTSGYGKTLGQRWSSFENRLRADRERITERCGVCTTRPGVQRSDVEKQRKVS